ncbi:exopolysaccharide biosynthesis protein [Paradevosia shaoguanensis]|uniref:exopolysaccharide biosynthesis protein n=1 Tax=Paradevosia shaoguanensis TaxID=1335043 RepID=UPI001934A27C|nr:exopolysaccharide biosynthesis protein [Paradevosia shaoguanensis]
MTEAPARPLEGLIDAIAARAAQGESISVATIQEIAGDRIAGPLLFFPAMIVVSPLSLIPTLPTIVGTTVVLIAGQLIAGRKSIWLPSRLSKAALSPERTRKALEFIRPVVKWIEKLSWARLTFLTDGLGMRLAAMVCILVALTMPPLELVPGASTSAGTIIATFGLALTTRDGLLLLAALALVLGSAFLLFRWLF